MPVTHFTEAFDPAAVELLTAAYNEAVDALGLPRRPEGNPAGSEQFKVAQRMISTALTGERDPARLRAAALGRSQYAA